VCILLCVLCSLPLSRRGCSQAARATKPEPSHQRGSLSGLLAGRTRAQLKMKVERH
jgi:hypothetical protein